MEGRGGAVGGDGGVSVGGDLEGKGSRYVIQEGEVVLSPDHNNDSPFVQYHILQRHKLMISKKVWSILH